MIIKRITGTVFVFFLTAFSFTPTFAQVKDDTRPVVDDSRTTPAQVRDPKLPTLWIVGDSTLNSNAPLRGWGQELAQFFDLSKINVVNRAIGGRSSRTFQYEGRWDKLLSELKKGDFVILQFGHNDVGQYDDPKSKDRPSLHSEGEETAEATRLDGKKEIVHSFGWYMRKYGNDVRERGAMMIFCSMVPHKDWDGGRIVRKEREKWVKWTANAAAATDAAYIDLNEIVALEFERLGPDKVAPLFGDARTHSTPAGALLNAQMVVAGIRALKNPDLKKYLSATGKAIEKTSATNIAAMK
ncbi:MAG TPA: rhamnogalacturonan acetylesterase [Pyrinomonadaceae bacterium]|nr:rhamnogalacturonan acetylesterase [Pyrinomonadaceae bacterium]